MIVSIQESSGTLPVLKQVLPDLETLHPIRLDSPSSPASRYVPVSENSAGLEDGVCRGPWKCSGLKPDVMTFRAANRVARV